MLVGPPLAAIQGEGCTGSEERALCTCDVEPWMATGRATGTFQSPVVRAELHFAGTKTSFLLPTHPVARAELHFAGTKTSSLLPTHPVARAELHFAGPKAPVVFMSSISNQNRTMST